MITKGQRDPALAYIQIARNLNLGVEMPNGRAWVGVDQQVGHGSADALFWLTDAQYSAALANSSPDSLGPGFLAECWRGERADLLLFSPAGGRWVPDRWHPVREPMMPQPFSGELWRHIDALGESMQSEHVAVSRLLAAESADIIASESTVTQMTFRLSGDRAYPRPSALIGGLDRDSDRAHVEAVLGPPAASIVDAAYLVGGAVIRPGYDESGRLHDVSIGDIQSLARPPDGAIGTVLAALGRPEEGAEYRAVAALVHGPVRFWAPSSRRGRRLIDLAGVVELQVEHDQVLSIRVTPGRRRDSDLLDIDAMIPGMMWPPSRAAVRHALGRVVWATAATDLFRYGRADLLVDYGVTAAGETARSLRAVQTGVSVSDRIYRWRSGEFSRLLDVLGRASSNPLATWARDLPGVRLTIVGGAVSVIEIDGRKSPDRLRAFVDGAPYAPTPTDIKLGTPVALGSSSVVWRTDVSTIHARLGKHGDIIGLVIAGVDNGVS